jgi:hypothetical protein
MIYLIETQRGRKLEEILYDFNAENISDRITKEEYGKAYRRREFKLKTRMCLAFFAFTCVYGTF